MLWDHAVLTGNCRCRNRGFAQFCGAPRCANDRLCVIFKADVMAEDCVSSAIDHLEKFLHRLVDQLHFITKAALLFHKIQHGFLLRYFAGFCNFVRCQAVLRQELEAIQHTGKRGFPDASDAGYQNDCRHITPLSS